MSLDTTGQASAGAETFISLPEDNDAELSAIWNKMERDNGAERGDDGRFASEEGNGVVEASAEDAAPANSEPQEGSEAVAATSTTPVIPAAPLPANWRGMDDVWSKIPADLQGQIAEHQNKLHRTVTEQGREIASARPLLDVVQNNRDLFDGRNMPDGQQATGALALQSLFDAQRGLESNPVGTLIHIAEMYGATAHLAQALGAALAGQSVPSQPGLSRDEAQRISRAEAERVAQERWEQDRRQREGDELISRLSKDKPLFSEIPEERMLIFVNDAKSRLGETASPDAVFNLAYDMAVNADPLLREKVRVSAASQKPPAPKADPKRTADAKAAASINVTSTSSAKGRQLTEDEELAQIWRDAYKG